MENEWHPFRSWDGRPFSPAPASSDPATLWALLKRLPFTVLLLALMVVGMNLVLVASLAVSLLCAQPGSRCRARVRALAQGIAGRRWAR